MEIILIIIGIIWMAGFINEVARIDAAVSSKNLEKPHKGIMLFVWMFMFFTWPYWYFYNKH